MTRSFKNGKGFTVIELLIVAAIIGILTTMILAASPEAREGFALRRSAQKLAQDIRKMLGAAMAMKEIDGMPRGYGIYLADGASGYILFADMDGNWQWESATDTLIADISFESNVEISALEAGGVSTSTLNIVFQPPDPTVWINSSSSSSSTITLELTGQTRTIFVDSTGLITTQ